MMVAIISHINEFHWLTIDSPRVKNIAHRRINHFSNGFQIYTLQDWMFYLLHSWLYKKNMVRDRPFSSSKQHQYFSHWNCCTVSLEVFLKKDWCRMQAVFSLSVRLCIFFQCITQKQGCYIYGIMFITWMKMLFISLTDMSVVCSQSVLITDVK